MRTETIERTTKEAWDFQWFQSGLCGGLTSRGDLFHSITHERDLPPISEAFPKRAHDIATEEIRKHRPMGDDEFYGPDGYVRFEMNCGRAVAVLENGFFGSVMYPQDKVEALGVHRKYHPRRSHLRAWWLQYHAPKVEWEVSDWLDVGHVSVNVQRGNVFSHYPIAHESELSQLPADCPAETLALARKRIRANRPLAKNEVRKNGEIYELFLRGDYVGFEGDTRFHRDAIRDDGGRFRNEGWHKSTVIWLSDAERLAAFDKCQEFWDANRPLEPNEYRDENGKVQTLADDEHKIEDGDVYQLRWNDGERQCRHTRDRDWITWNNGGENHETLARAEAWFAKNKPLEENEALDPQGDRCTFSVQDCELIVTWSGGDTHVHTYSSLMRIIGEYDFEWAKRALSYLKKNKPVPNLAPNQVLFDCGTVGTMERLMYGSINIKTTDGRACYWCRLMPNDCDWDAQKPPLKITSETQRQRVRDFARDGGWSVSEWCNPGATVLCGDWYFRTFLHERDLATLPTGCPQHIRDLARDRIEAHRELAPDEIRKGGKVFKLRIERWGDVVFDATRAMAFCWNPNIAAGTWLSVVEDWLSDSERLAAFDKCQEFWDANRPLEPNEYRDENGKVREICGVTSVEAVTQSRIKPEYYPQTTEQKLGKLVEECGEVLAAAGKAQRWGLGSTNPELPPEEQETNRDWLLRELLDLKESIAIVEADLGPAGGGK